MKTSVYILSVVCLAVTIISSCKKSANNEDIAMPVYHTFDTHPANGHDVSVYYFKDGTGADSLNASSTNFYGDSLLYINAFTSPFNQTGSSVYLKFDSVNAVPSNATIAVAKIYLYGNDTSNIPVSFIGNKIAGGGNSWSNNILDSILYYDSVGVANYNTHADTAFDNTLITQLVTSSWDAKTITFNTQPGVISTDSVLIASSAFRWNNNISIDVTSQVKQWFQNPSSNFGINISLLNTNYGPGNFYINHQAVFYSSAATDPFKRPELIIVYQ